jgi:UDP-GlcNAc:undecaprenyl-phosphate/decaprenyl-phosphate GlcNAc-1-phosphate transferase
MVLFGWLLAVTVIPSAILSWGTIAVIRALPTSWQLFDRPDSRKLHDHPIPLGGGIGLWLGLVGCFAFGSLAVYLWQFSGSLPFVPNNVGEYCEGCSERMADLWWLIFGGSVLMLLGLADDRYKLPWQLRLSVETTVAFLVVWGLNIRLTAFIESTWVTVSLSVLWIVVLINSFNMLDNMDGLSGGVACLASSIFAIILLVQPASNENQPQVLVAAIFLVLSGCLLGFLFHNWPPAKIFMGDAGSYFVGYWMAIATLMTTYSGTQSDRPHAIVAPLCVLAIPLYDMASVLWIRLREGRSLFHADRRHFSHRLVELGMTKKQAVLTIYLATITCGLSAMLLNRTDTVGAIIVLLTVLAILALIAVLENFAGQNDE